ncbi:MAG: DUF5683 domain-containing protein, partial [Flammeovirgaceae bacterium]
AFLLACFIAKGQNTQPDSIKIIKTDTVSELSTDSVMRRGKKVSVKSYAAKFNPRKALLYSAILPGAGQFYNKKYWKVPLVYGGIIGLGLVVDFYNQANNKFRNELFGLLNSGQALSTSGLDETQLRTIIDQSRRQRDYFMIFVGFFYILQMVDAHVDAHLKEFDVNPRLRARIEPAMDNSYLTGSTVGLALTLRF